MIGVLNAMALWAMPAMIGIIIGHGLLRRVEVFSCFQGGAKEGVRTVYKILPALVGIFVGISMFRASGALGYLTAIVQPILGFLGIPSEVFPLAIMRPISGSASIALVTEMVGTHGISSYIGRVASVMMGASETTFYCIALYYGSVGIRDVRWTVKAALVGDIAGVLLSVWVVRMLFGI